MRKKHFLALAGAVTRALDRMAEWSTPGTDGRMVGLDVAEDILLGELGGFVESQGGDAERWKLGIRRVAAGMPFDEPKYLKNPCAVCGAPMIGAHHHER